MERSERTTLALTTFGDDILRLWEPEELFTLAREVEKLTASPGWRAIFEVLDRGRERAMARLMHGGTRPEAELRRDLGFLSGVDQVSLAAHAIVEGAERQRRRFDEEKAAESVAEGSQQ